MIQNVYRGRAGTSPLSQQSQWRSKTVNMPGRTEGAAAVSFFSGAPELAGGSRGFQTGCFFDLFPDVALVADITQPVAT